MTAARTPVRTCVGCGARAPSSGLLRLSVGPDGWVRVDPGGRSGGRGAHVHPADSCLRAAATQRVMGRAFRGKGKNPGEDVLLDQARPLMQDHLTVKSASD